MDLALEELLHDAVPFALPLRRRFRGLDVREGLLIRGPAGWGEFAPFDDYSAERAARWLAAAAEAAFGRWPEPRRREVRVNAIVPAVPAADAARLAREAVLDRGCTTIKVKVAEPGELLADDEARVVSVRDAADSAMRAAGLEGSAALRLDANGGWSRDEAIRALGRLAAYGLEYVEQPCRDLADVAAVRSETGIPVAVDEGVRLGVDADEAIASVADVVIVKAAPLGGVAAAMDRVERIGLPAVVSGALDSAVGLAAGIALAAALPGEPMACGLGTGALLAADVIATPLVPAAGRLPVGRVTPELDALMAARARLGEEASRAWRARAQEAWDAGGAVLIAGLPGPEPVRQ